MALRPLGPFIGQQARLGRRAGEQRLQSGRERTGKGAPIPTIERFPSVVNRGGIPSGAVA
jgi:hypothetical protein